MDEFLRCPCCGGDPWAGDGVPFASCMDCDLRIEKRNMDKSIEAWNRRDPDGVYRLGQALEVAALRSLVGTWQKLAGATGRTAYADMCVMRLGHALEVADLHRAASLGYEIGLLDRA